MAFNQILAKKVIGTTMKDGVAITLSVATKTSTWNRLETAVVPVGAALTKAVAVWPEPLPKGTVEICSRETDHTSPADKKDHLTVVCFNDSGNGTTRHVPVAK